jgi:hypothetical protein
MASRLSEDRLRGVYDTGYQALPIRSVISELAPPTVDLDGLLLSEDPVGAVQAVAPQVLYHALVEKGPEDALEVLELISEEQLTRILDYDAWAEDSLVPVKMVRWLDLFKELGTEQLYRRFRDLEEEYQVALLGPIIDVVDEEQYEKLTDVQQDELHRLPCGTLYYKVGTTDPRIAGFVESLVEATLAHDLNYAYALLTHAAFMPPNESEEAIARFRRARLEEDGFVTYQESLRYFAPIDLVALRAKWVLRSGAVSETAYLKGLPTGRRLLDQALTSDAFSASEREHLSRGFAVLANALCATTKIEPDDARGLRRLFAQAQALSNLGLEWLAQGDLELATTVLKVESPQVLFRSALSLVHQLTSLISQRMIVYGVVDSDKIAKHASLDRPGLVLAALDQVVLPVLGMNRVEVLKGAYNRFPVRPSSPEGLTGELDLAHVEFSPIDSLASLRDLAQSLDGISGIMHVASLALDGAPIGLRAVDSVILRALAHGALGGSFEFVSFDDDAVKRLSHMTKKDVMKSLEDALHGIEDSLRAALLPETLKHGEKGWAVSRDAHIYVEDPMRHVTTELGALKDQLLLAHQHGHLFELLRETLS